MNPKIIVTNIITTNNSILYNFTYSNALKDYFNSEESFFIEYGVDQNKDLDLASVSDSLLIVPFLCNILPIAWILDAEVKVKAVDKSFYESVSMFKNGYINMYPNVEFKGSLNADEIIENRYEIKENNNLAFFSGGVDAFNTLVNHIEEKPILLTLWGSDIFFKDIKGWNNVKQHIEKTAVEFNLEYFYIKSNFRKFLNEGALSLLVANNAKDNWWHGFQHGIGLIGHAAPLAYLLKSNLVYIASSFTSKDAGKVPCASDPTIDNFVRFANCQTIHDGYEFTRQDKIRNITKYAIGQNKPIELRVCWQSSGGKNCCKCEKCYRTIMGILAEEGDPNSFGLSYKKEDSHTIKKFIKYKLKMNSVSVAYWQDIQQRFLENQDIKVYNPELKWIYTIDFKTINNNPGKKAYFLYHRIINNIKRIISK